MAAPGPAQQLMLPAGLLGSCQAGEVQLQVLLTGVALATAVVAVGQALLRAQLQLLMLEMTCRTCTTTNRRWRSITIAAVAAAVLGAVAFPAAAAAVLRGVQVAPGPTLPHCLFRPWSLARLPLAQVALLPCDQLTHPHHLQQQQQQQEQAQVLAAG